MQLTKEQIPKDFNIYLQRSKNKVGFPSVSLALEINVTLKILRVLERVETHETFFEIFP